VVVAEGNQGGELVRSVIRSIDPTVPVEIVHARDGKRARAEPIAHWWQPGQQRASIVGSWPELEDQLTTWSDVSSESPDRLDAMVWLGHWAKDRMFTMPVGFSAKSSKRRVPMTLQPSGSVLPGFLEQRRPQQRRRRRRAGGAGRPGGPARLCTISVYGATRAGVRRVRRGERRTAAR
jgi:hypothetical protein